MVFKLPLIYSIKITKVSTEKKPHLISSARVGSIGNAMAWNGCTLGRRDIWKKTLLKANCMKKTDKQGRHKKLMPVFAA